MSTIDEQLLSQKIHNYNYAPGIATYGIDGKQGTDGADGNNIYYTDFDIKNNIIDIAKQIITNYLPLKNSTIKINRSYKNGDYFFDNYGTIYKLIDIDTLTKVSSESETYQKYFAIVGKIKLGDDNFVSYTGDRLVINSSTYNGFDIISSDSLSEKINNDAALNIVSDSIDENNRIQLLQLNAIDSNSLEDSTSLVYYDTTDNAFHLNSNVPVVIDADVKINNDSINTEYDNYSTILTSKSTITYFKSLCDKLTYNITTGQDGKKYMLIYAKDYETEDASGANMLQELIDKSVYAKVYGENGQQTFVLIDSYDSNQGNLTTISNSSISICGNWCPDVNDYFNVEPEQQYSNSFDISISYKYPELEHFDISNGNNNLTLNYKGKREITYWGKEEINDNIDQKRMTRTAYIYNYDDTGVNRNLAIFNPMLLIGSNDGFYSLEYYKDYVYYTGSWDAASIAVDSSQNVFDLSKRTVYDAATTLNKNTYIQLGVGSYNCKFEAKNDPSTLSMYANTTHGFVDINMQTYSKSGEYTYKFIYIEPEELEEMQTNPSFGLYKHSISTDFFYIKVRNPLYKGKVETNYIAERLFHLNYVLAHKSEYKVTADNYPQFIDGEEYTFKFTLYIGDDGAKISNATLSGKLKNNASNENIPAFRAQIPDFIGDTGKVSLMYNTEIFLS